jgi:TRAP-type C4-dicarboxylate transport system permease small subunit
MLTLHACAAISGIFALSEMTRLLHACAEVLEILLGILLCSMTVLIVSGVVLMMMGGGSTSA